MRQDQRRAINIAISDLLKSQPIDADMLQSLLGQHGLAIDDGEGAETAADKAWSSGFTTAIDALRRQIEEDRKETDLTICIARPMVIDPETRERVSDVVTLDEVDDMIDRVLEDHEE